MPRLRIAFFSPFNPQKSGVSDYSEELLPHLAEYADIDLVADRYPLSNEEIRSRFRVIDVAEFLRTANVYDVPIYQVANSFHQHGYLLEAMQRFPGVAVLHDYYLHFLMLGLTLQRGDMELLRRILEASYGQDAPAYARRLWLSTQDPYAVSLVRPLIDMARSVVTHSQCARELVLTERREKPVHVIPMAMPVVDVDRREELRRKHGISPGDFVLASVSTLSHTKRIELLLSAAARLAQVHPGFRLFVLGGGQLGDRARRAIGSPELASRVFVPGWTNAETYQELLIAVDAVVDLRYPSGAETSASILRAIAAGRPCVVSAQGSFLELPDSLSFKVPVHQDEIGSVERIVTRLIQNPGLCSSMSAAAMSFASAELGLPQAAKRYLEVARESCELAPGAAWPLTTQPRAAIRAFWSTSYKLFRIRYMFRNYGFGQTVRRLQSEARLRAAA
jgi:glycosyltransferase involved in cell wall biosynthesis